VKAGWRVVPLGDVCSITKKQGGTRPLPYVGLEDIASGGEGLFLGSFDPQTDKSTTFEFEPGHVLYGRLRPYLNKVLLPDFVGHCSSEIFPLLPAPQLDRRFLFHWLTNQQTVDAINSTCTGARMPRANVAELMTFHLPLPPLDEQKRIVAVLDEAFEGLSRARANAEANLADVQALAINYLRNLFSECARFHSSRRIGDIAEHCLGKMLDKNKNQGTMRPYLRNINVRWFEVDTSDMLEMRIEDREVERYSAKKGDLLICEGGYPGRAAVWDKDQPVFFQKALHRVRFSNPVYAAFLMNFLFMKDATGQLKEHFTGSGIQHFTGQAVAKFELPFPDLMTAEKIVFQIQQMNATTSALQRQYQTTISQLETLRQSLLQKAFAGKLK